MPAIPACGATLFDLLPVDFSRRSCVLRDRHHTLSGGELIAQASRLAGRLSALPGQRIAVFADNGVPWLVADLACQLAAKPLLPLPGFFSTTQLIHAITEAGIELVLLAADSAGSNPVFTRYLTSHFQGVDTLSGLQLLARRNRPSSPLPPLPQGTGKITYTSGSTGAPRGVCLGNAQLLRQAAALAATLGLANPRHLCLLPLSVLLENVAGVYCPLIAGGEVIVPPQGDLGFSGSSTLDTAKLTAAISHYQPQTLILTPQLLAVLVAACAAGWRAPASLVFIAVGGSRVAAATIAAAREFGLPVFEGYGLSECASVVSLNTPAADRPGSAGKPLAHLRVTVVAGEVVVAGNPFLGYVGDPASWGQGAIASGDLGRLDNDGYLHLEGRRKNLLISSFGRNISPEWVESEISANTLIRDCVVFGDARPFLVAMIHPRPGVTDGAIERWLAEVNGRLPDYARVRNWQRLETPLAEFPGLMTATGKPRREAIHTHFLPTIEALYHLQPEAVSP